VAAPGRSLAIAWPSTHGKGSPSSVTDKGNSSGVASAASQASVTANGRPIVIVRGAFSWVGLTAGRAWPVATRATCPASSGAS